MSERRRDAAALVGGTNAAARGVPVNVGNFAVVAKLAHLLFEAVNFLKNLVDGGSEKITSGAIRGHIKGGPHGIVRIPAAKS